MISPDSMPNGEHFLEADLNEAVVRRTLTRVVGEQFGVS
jgi:hypothetical protein